MLRNALLQIVTPLLPFLFKHIVSGISPEVDQQQSIIARHQIHLLAVMFLLIEQYPKEAEEQDFTRRSLIEAIKIGDSPISSKMVRRDSIFALSHCFCY
jgi:positive regulator of sigma E activity